MLSKLVHILKNICKHPLNRHRKLKAIIRFVRWQLSQYLWPGPRLVPLLGETNLIVDRRMHGATANIYTGLYEFNEIAFLLHCLRKEDLFIDIGANVGVYSVLASGQTGSRTICFEPVKSSREALKRNIIINELHDHVQIRAQGLGAEEGELTFSASHMHPCNHVIEAEARVSSEVEKVPVTTLDKSLEEQDARWLVVKLDVEGFEFNVLSGAKKTFESGRVLALIIEMNQSGLRFGVKDDQIDELLKSWGFSPYEYRPLERTLVDFEDKTLENRIYIKDMDTVMQRVKSAMSHTVNGVEF